MIWRRRKHDAELKAASLLQQVVAEALLPLMATGFAADQTGRSELILRLVLAVVWGGAHGAYGRGPREGLDHEIVLHEVRAQASGMLIGVQKPSVDDPRYREAWSILHDDALALSPLIDSYFDGKRPNDFGVRLLKAFIDKRLTLTPKPDLGVPREVNDAIVHTFTRAVGATRV